MLAAYIRRRQLTTEQRKKKLPGSLSANYYRMVAPDMSVHTLWAFSQELKHNFIMDVACALPPFDDDTPSEKEKALQQRIDELQRTVDTQNIELNVYRNIVKKQ
jgi:hypothetical protein